MSVAIRVFSDIHVEHQCSISQLQDNFYIQQLNNLITPLEQDSNSVLVIAGDLMSSKHIDSIYPFLNALAQRFFHIIYVLGNHEHYGGDINQTEDRIITSLNQNNFDMSKITIAGNSVKRYVVDDVTFLCGTLWTNYANLQADVVRAIKYSINDHRAIRNGSTIFQPEDGYKIFNFTIQELTRHLERGDNSKTVVVTHHMPSLSAVHPQYKNDIQSIRLNFAFASDLDDFILKYNPTYWFFGHTHTPYEGILGSTKIYCNPYGYPRENNLSKNLFKQNRVFTL